jgi:hypothetical protein
VSAAVVVARTGNYASARFSSVRRRAIPRRSQLGFELLAQELERSRLGFELLAQETLTLAARGLV